MVLYGGEQRERCKIYEKKKRQQINIDLHVHLHIVNKYSSNSNGKVRVSEKAGL